MDIIAKFDVGSNAFFSSFEDFEPKDDDCLVIMKKTLSGRPSEHKKIGRKDYFFYKEMSKYEMIKMINLQSLSMRAASFFVPEFVKYYNVTISDLDLLKEKFEDMDKKHTYVTMIYHFYKENNGFYLTDEQLKAVYSDYKKTRGLS